VGQTIKLLGKRANEHYRLAKKDKTKFGNALLKYKKEDFEWTILRECESIDEMNLWGQFYIKLFSCVKRDYGYNLQSGGNNFLHSEETKKRMSIAQLKRWTEIGRKKIT